MVQKLEMGYCPLSMRLGAGQAWAQAGVQGVGHWAQARVAGVRMGVQGVLALGVGEGARAAGERQRRWGTQAAKARRCWGAQASGTAWARGALAGARGWAAATRRARGRRRQGRAGRLAGRPVRVWCAQLGQVGCFGAPDSVFGLV